MKASEYNKYISTQLVGCLTSDEFGHIADNIKVPDTDDYTSLLILLNLIERKYEFDMAKMVEPNYQRFYLWQEYFCKKIDNNKILIAIKFIIYCSLVDKILDSKRFNEQQHNNLIDKLYDFNSAFCINNKSSQFKELDILWNDIYEFFVNNQNDGDKKIIYSMIKRAFESEIYMATHLLMAKERITKEDFPKLIDKSVQFEKAAFAISIFGKNMDKSFEAAECIGNIFWVIDDLCDFVEDVNCRRKNSLLYISSEEGELLLQDRINKSLINVDSFISILVENLEKLKHLTNEEIFGSIYHETIKWGAKFTKY